MKKHFNISIYGLVQGIFFRVGAKDTAEELGLSGFAKNMPDGSVYIEAEGEKKNLEKLVKWCNVGPSLAQVEKVDTKEASLKNFTEFSIN